ncbi:helix-turn-helix transcriptional regulator [Streptomyces sp. STR69]|uniref:helix-turn-helix transcriptional regulator n=1 Tax=Streptomyces sp. STR69 TaxID=1796942 RepID=UPI0021CAAD1F|nr:LuxR family transcriptional regulator [Streptomyces sp. STR69]
MRTRECQQVRYMTGQSATGSLDSRHTSSHGSGTQTAGQIRPSGGGAGSRGEFVGRQAEMQQVMTALAAARSGRGGTVFVTGEPGIGKTRLAVEALRAAAAAGMITARGRAGTVGSVVPYRPLVEALLSLSRAGLLPDPDELGLYGPVLAHLLPGDFAPGTAVVSHLMVAETLLRVLAAAGREHGFLLVLDDLHDADTETLAVLEYVLDNLAEQPAVMLLIAGREPCVATELAARASQRGAASILELRPLGRPDVRTLVVAGLGSAPGAASAELVDTVVADSTGNPLVVEELLHDVTLHSPDGSRRIPVPAAVARSVRCRTGRLDPRGRTILGIAALFGQRFPLSALQRAAECDDRELLTVLQAGVASYLLEPDRSSPDWYAFRPRLAAQVLLEDLGPTERTGYARLAANTLVDLHPGLPGEWCVHAADLFEQAGDTREAVPLYCEAARRAMTEGAVERAVTLLTRAQRSADAGPAPELRATVLELLLQTVSRAARFDAVPGLTADLEALGGHEIPAARRAGLYARLADVTASAGRPTDALRHLDVARRLLGPSPTAAHTAPVDLASARVELSRPAPDRLRTAAGYARRAADAAEQADLPDVLGGALLMLGRLAPEHDEEAAAAHFARAGAIADLHRLPDLRVSAEVHLARSALRRDGQPAGLEEAQQRALRISVLPLAHETGCVLALDQVRRGEFEAAGRRIREGLIAATRLRLRPTVSMMRLAEAVRFAHQGRRAEMEEALDRLAPGVDDAPGVRPMSYGLARAFCSLLEENHDAAEREFAQALVYDKENPGVGEYGAHDMYGVMLLRGVLAGRAGRRHYADVTRAGGGTRWNRQFIGAAHAVLLGREGRPAEATAAATAALEAAAPYPPARNLCLRLVSRSAYEDGWGEPVDWVREAEEYFHGLGVPAVAAACRSLLRGMGAPVRQRRTGTEHVPPDLRRCGVTVREFEVARLLVERIGNKDIADWLHISPRTVEKHVASLLRKTGHPDRAAFAAAARGPVAERAYGLRRVAGPHPAMPVFGHWQGSTEVE